MALPKTRPAGGVLVASAIAGTGADRKKSEYSTRKSLDWQNRALSYLDLVPELNYGSRFYSRMLKQVRFFPGRLETDGRITEIKEGPPVERLAQLRDPGGGRSQLQGQYGRLMFATGEGGLFGRDIATERERWSFVWTDEVKLVVDGRDNVQKIIHMPHGESGKKTEYNPSQARWYPMWMPHPRLSGEADAPMRSVLDIAEELIVLTAAVRATAVTRLTNGVLFAPTEASPGPATSDADEDPEEDPFAADLGAHFAAQVENPGDAEARVPPIVWVQEDLVEKFRHVKFHDPATDYVERELRRESIERMALGMDMPPEALTGLGDSNHWSAIQILGDMWKSHGLGVALQFATDLADVYLRPGLRDDGYDGWEDVVIGVDGSQVVQKADRADEAVKAIQEFAIGPSGFRKMLNIPDDYAPSTEELEFMLLVNGRGQAAQNGGAPQRNGSRNGDGDMPPEQPPAPGPEGDSGRRTRVVAAAFREMGAAELALMRCRELAGMRIRNQRTWKALQAICRDCADTVEEAPLGTVASSIGPEIVQKLRLDPVVLTRGGADSLRELLKGWGYPVKQAEALAEMVEVFAARSLFDKRAPALPSGFETQIASARELLDAVGHRAA